MKLLIDDAKAAFLEMAALCGCYAEGKSVYRDKCPLHCDATIDGFLTDRRTLLARIAELEERLRTTAQTLVKCVGADGPANADEIAMRAVAKIADLLTDRETLLAEIKELKEVIRDRDAEIKDFYRIQP